MHGLLSEKKRVGLNVGIIGGVLIQNFKVAR
jgi:hypothetical protein